MQEDIFETIILLLIDVISRTQKSRRSSRGIHRLAFNENSVQNLS